MQLIFHPRIAQNPFFVHQKLLSPVENSLIFLVPLYIPFLTFCTKKGSTNFSSSSFPPLVSSDGTTAVLPSAKTELLGKTFVSNSTIGDSGAIPLPSTPLTHLFQIL